MTPLLARILPATVAVAETFADLGVSPHPDEAAALRYASSARQAEFATGRACARAALRQFDERVLPSCEPRNWPASPALPPTPTGPPAWPPGFTGSVTHCAGYRACAVGRGTDFAAIGIDAEPDQPLPPGALDLVITAAERGRLPDRLVFCAKEAACKAWHVLTGTCPRIQNAIIVPTLTARSDGGFRVLESAAGPALSGRWLRARGLLLTAIVVCR